MKANLVLLLFSKDYIIHIGPTYRRKESKKEGRENKGRKRNKKGRKRNKAEKQPIYYGIPQKGCSYDGL